MRPSFVSKQQSYFSQTTHQRSIKMLGRTTIVLLTTAAAAIALPPALDKRCGTTILPSSLYSLQQQFPDQTFPNTPTFLVQQTFDPEARRSHHHPSPPQPVHSSL